MRTSRYRRFYEHTLLGCRLGFGDARRAVMVSAWAALRHGLNWFLPAMTVLFFTTFHAGMVMWNPIPSSGMGNLAFRIILGDYFLFLIGWVAAWNAAAKWRRHETLLEELVTTNLRPQVVGSILFAGSLNIWILALGGLAIVDGILVFYSMLYPVLVNVHFEFSILFIVYTFIALIVAVAFGVLIGWFHLESLRIAFWLFSIAALAKINLRHKAIENLFSIGGIVILLTMAGSGITAVSMGLLTVFGAILQSVIPGFFFHGAVAAIGWSIASILGMTFIIFLKRKSSIQFESDFCKYFLMYTWWGAGESVHPKAYPRYYMQAAAYWRKWLLNQEEEEHGKELYRQKHGAATPTPGANFPEDAKPECTND